MSKARELANKLSTILSADASPIEAPSMASTPIGSIPSDNILITGTTTITAFDTIAAGAKRTITFSGALTLTHNATSLILPGAANITTSAGDVAEFMSLGSGNWRCVQYMKASGAAVLSAVAGSQTFTSGTVATFEKPNANYLKIQGWGGGGGGSRYAGMGGCGGGGGSYMEITIPLDDITGGITYTVGAGGAGSANNAAGGAGGDTKVTFTQSGVSKTFTAYGGGGANSSTGGGGAGTHAAGKSGALGGTGGVLGGGNGGIGAGARVGLPATNIYGGGGGGAGANAAVGAAGGYAIYGGGGGGGGNDDSAAQVAGGVSIYGGNGGYGLNTVGQDGAVPGGGGGGSSGSAAGSGGSGQIIFTWW